MRRVYIAGPYTGSNYLAIDDNINRARKVAALLAEHGIGFFCPHTHSAHFEAIVPEVPPKFWYELAILFLRECDAVYFLPGWQQSVGCLAEKDEADRLGLPVFEYVEQVMRWAGVSK